MSAGVLRRGCASLGLFLWCVAFEPCLVIRLLTIVQHKNTVDTRNVSDINAPGSLCFATYGNMFDVQTFEPGPTFFLCLKLLKRKRTTAAHHNKFRSCLQGNNLRPCVSTGIFCLLLMPEALGSQGAHGKS